MAEEARRRRDNGWPYQNQSAAASHRYGLSHIERFDPRAPTGIARLGAARGPARFPHLDRHVENETRAKRKLRQALRPGWDGPVIDQFPGERVEAVYLVKTSNISCAERLSEREVDELQLGDLIRTTVCESTTNTNHSFGLNGTTPSYHGMKISKFRYHILVKKHPKHGVFAPISSREKKGLEDLSEAERLTRVGFCNEGETFNRAELTEDDSEFLSLNDPLELHKGSLDPGSFADLSYPTSLYWSSNLIVKGYLKDSSTRRVLDMFERTCITTTEPVEENGTSTITVGDGHTSTTDRQSISEPLKEMEALAGGTHFEAPSLDDRTADGENDTDKPKGTANEQKAAFDRRQSVISSALRPQKEIEESLVREIENATLLAAEAENKARKAKFEYEVKLSTGEAGEYALESCKEAAEQAAHDCARKQQLKDSMIALFDDVLSNPDLRPRVAVGEEVNQERMTIINNAAHSLKCRLESIWGQM